MQSYFEFCRQTVIKNTPDLYHISLIARQAEQSQALWAAFAFASEIATIRRMVTEPTMGLIRLQWWRDELAKLYNTPPEPHAASEILTALKHVIHTNALPAAPLLALLDAYDDELRLQAPPASAQDAMTLLTRQHAPVIQLTALIAQEKLDEDTCNALALNRGILDVLPRAKETSIVGQAKATFINAYKTDLAPHARMCQAFHTQQNIAFNRMRRLKFDQHNPKMHTPPPLALLRLWTSLLGK